MAEREFGPSLSHEIGALWHEYDHLTSLRKHEHIDSSTFSLLHFDEADLVLNRWKSLLTTAEATQRSVSQAEQPSFFELVLYPIKASLIFVNLQISIGRNQLYALQRRNSANSLFHAVLSLFNDDFSLSSTFHALLHGRWSNIASQPHYGIGPTWHAPSRDMISGLSYVQRRQDSSPIAGQMGVCVEGHAGVRPGVCNEASDLTHPSRRDLIPGVTLGLMTRYGPQKRWFDVFTRGSIAIHWNATTPFSWLKLSATSGTLNPDGEDNRATITVDWTEVPEAFNQSVSIDIHSMEGDYEQIHLPMNGRRIPPPSNIIKSFRGFVESNGYVSIPASKCPISPPYYHLPDLGREIHGAVTLVPGTTISEIEIPPYLIYPMYIFTDCSSPSCTTKPILRLYFNMTLDFDPEHPMTYDVLIDNLSSRRYRLLEEPTKSVIIPSRENPGALPEGWDQAVQDCAWVRSHEIDAKAFGPGKHDIGIMLRHSNLVLEKIVVDLGGLRGRGSYLGPPMSFYVE